MLCVKILPDSIGHFVYLQIFLVVRGINRGNLGILDNWLDLSNMLYELNPCVCIPAVCLNFQNPGFIPCPKVFIFSFAPFKVSIEDVLMMSCYLFSSFFFNHLIHLFSLFLLCSVICKCSFFSFHIFSSSCVHVFVIPENTFFTCSLYHFTPFLCFRCCVYLI